MSRMLKSVPRSLILAALCGFVAGLLWLVAARFITYKDDQVHYHANFALYINGQREEFKNFTFYEEVQSCSGDDSSNPKTRVHMHDNKGHVVHVHDDAATWGHFFANLGFGLSNDVLKTNQGIYIDDQDGNKLRFILNGQPITGVANRTITSQDVLLISYGQADQATLQQQYQSITKDADHFNQTSDPSSCAGSHALSWTERLRRAVGLF